jgi:hypothetical protein
MGLIYALLIAVAGFGIVSYFMQYSFELDSNPENIIKDGLVKELIERTVNDPSIPYTVEENKITVGRFEIKKNDEAFWFPYYVYKTALPYRERHDIDDWGEKVGYVRWLSNDWKLINDLLKKNKKPVEQKQRQKLNLEK